MKILSQMSGWVVSIHIHVGQRIEPGTVLITLESMKMQIPIESPVLGVVTAIHVKEEDVVQEGDLLLELN